MKDKKELTLEEEEKKRIKKEKMLAKRRKNKELMNSYTVDLDVIKEDEDIIKLKIVTNFVFKPYERTRKGSVAQMYDPLGSYKNNIKKKILNCEKFPNILAEGSVTINIKSYLKLPKNASKRQILYSLKKERLPKIKPDTDNIEKTIYDIFKDLFYLDDNQINKNSHEKYYALEEKTEIELILEKKYNEYTGRLSKEEEEELCKILKELI